MRPPPPPATLFPYTTLFRSEPVDVEAIEADVDEASETTLESSEPVEVDQDELETPVDKDRKSTRLNSSHVAISYAVFCLKKKRQNTDQGAHTQVAEQVHLSL